MKFPSYYFTAQRDRGLENVPIEKDSRKGRYITVPDFKPPTQIFVKKGEDPKQAIKKFKDKRQKL